MSGRGWHRSLLVLTEEQEDCLQLEPMGCGSLEPTEVCLPAVDCWDGPDGEPPVAYWAPIDLGSSSFSILSFCLFVLFMGFSRQEY